jgi:hypothetical protein
MTRENEYVLSLLVGLFRLARLHFLWTAFWMNLYWAVNEMLSQQTYELPTIPVPVTLDLLDTSSRSVS